MEYMINKVKIEIKPSKDGESSMFGYRKLEKGHKEAIYTMIDNKPHLGRRHVFGNEPCLSSFIHEAERIAELGHWRWDIITIGHVDYHKIYDSSKQKVKKE